MGKAPLVFTNEASHSGLAMRGFGTRAWGFGPIALPERVAALGGFGLGLHFGDRSRDAVEEVVGARVGRRRVDLRLGRGAELVALGFEVLGEQFGPLGLVLRV